MGFIDAAVRPPPAPSYFPIVKQVRHRLRAPVRDRPSSGTQMRGCVTQFIMRRLTASPSSVPSPTSSEAPTPERPPDEPAVRTAPRPGRPPGGAHRGPGPTSSNRSIPLPPHSTSSYTSTEEQEHLPGPIFTLPSTRKRTVAVLASLSNRRRRSPKQGSRPRTLSPRTPPRRPQPARSYTCTLPGRTRRAETPSPAFFLKDRYTVDVAPDPLPGLTSGTSLLQDSLAGVAVRIVLVGGTPPAATDITDATTSDASVKALVYDDAYVPALAEGVGAAEHSRRRRPTPATVRRPPQCTGSWKAQTRHREGRRHVPAGEHRRRGLRR